MADRPELMSSSRLHGGAVALLAALALAAVAAASAFAAAPASGRPVFALSSTGAPGAMLVHGVPGSVLHEAVSVRNLSDHPIVVRVQSADIVNASNGNADYVTTPLAGAGQWLRLGAKTVRLKAHAVRRLALTVTVPKQTSGASHYAGVVAINGADLSTVAAHRKVKGREFRFYRVNRQALPITIRLPGRLYRSLALRSVRISVQPAGAGLVIGLLPGGSELTQQTQVKLRVRRGARTVLIYRSTLGQLFPGQILDFRIPWRGRPTTGTYHVQGTIRAQGAQAIDVNRTVRFTSAKAKQLTEQTPPVAQATTSGTPGWVWIALAGAAAAPIAVALAVWKLARRPAKAVA
jgi:hypothetical protein